MVIIYPPKGQDDIPKYLDLPKTQIYSVYCNRGVKK